MSLSEIITEQLHIPTQLSFSVLQHSLAPMPISSTNTLGCNIHLSSPFLKFQHKNILCKLYRYVFLSSYATKPDIFSRLFANIYYRMRRWIKFRDPPWYGFIYFAVTSKICPCSKHTFHDMYFEKSAVLPVHLHGGHVCAGERRKLRIMGHLISTPTNANI